MAYVKWIKITTDMFDNKKIKQLRKLPDGNNIVLIWVMLITMAGRCNSDGKIFLTEDIPYTTKTLAIELDFEESTVSFALQMLSKFGMIRTDDNYISISNWGKYQNIDGMERIREQTRNRVAKYRENKKQIAGSVTSSVTVTQGNAIDKDIDKEKDIDNLNNIYTQIVAYLNAKIGANYKDKTPKTQSLIRARLKEGFTLDDFKTVIDKKTAEWTGTEWEKFLRPETLFSTKFESYLNSKTTPRQAGPVYNGYSDEDLNALDDLY